MILVNLFTEPGHYVATVELPHYESAPGIILWGSRYFRRCADGYYRETFFVVSFTESPGLAVEIPPVGIGVE